MLIPVIIFCFTGGNRVLEMAGSQIQAASQWSETVWIVYSFMDDFKWDTECI